jgi:Uma2 family endonuclease
MTKTHLEVDYDAPRSFVLSMESVHLSDEQFYRLCHDNPDLRIELSADRELVIMSPTGSKTGNRNSKINQRLANWAEDDDTGICFDSSAGFTLPNGAKRSPDAAWVRREVWNALTEEEQEKFAPICPDFVVELRSPDDSLAALQEKMEEYIENGTQLGWLFNPPIKRVYIYRPGQPMECLENPSSLSGEPVLPGFVFDPSEIW